MDATDRRAFNGASRATAPELLQRLVALAIAGGVSHARGAALVGLRRETFVELCELTQGLQAVERQADRLLATAFARQFPWTDPAAWKQLRSATPRPGEHFAGQPSARDCELLAPPGNRDRKSGQRCYSGIE